MGKRLTLKGEAKKTLVDYFKETTVHGFRYIVEGRNVLERLIWGIVILFGFVFSFYAIWQAASHWETHPVETTIDQVGVPVQELPFPAITICDTKSLQMPRRNQWMFIETLLNSLEVTDPQQLIDGIIPGRKFLLISIKLNSIKIFIHTKYLSNVVTIKLL